MAKVTFIGAGSTVFARNLLRDTFTFPELSDISLALMDIDAQRLRTSEIVAYRVAEQADARPTIEATTDRRRALEGADYVINMIQVGGYQPATVIDFEIPKKYGLRQTIGDTLGIGGIMRALRTIPVLIDIARDMEQVCPQALFINYSNPMAMLCWALNEASSIKTVGLCHSVQGTAAYLGHLLGIPYENLTYFCAGINHMAFYTRFESEGEDLYPRLRRLLEEGKVPEHDRVRFEMLRRLGYFVTESSEHFAEYVPYFIRRDRPDLIEQFQVPLDEYPRRCERQIAEWQEMQVALESSDPEDIRDYERARMLRRVERIAEHDPERAAEMRRQWEAQENGGPPAHSGEYGTLIIHAMETNEPTVVYGNVMNYGLIDNLPRGCCVEVPCLVDGTGVQPVRVGELPPQLAALMRTSINVQDLTVRASLQRHRDYVYHAAMLDPHTAAELTVDQIYSMVDELIEAHGDYIPTFES